MLKTVCEDMDTFCRKSAHTHHKIFVANCDLSVLQKLDGVFALAKSQSSFATLVHKAEAENGFIITLSACCYMLCFLTLDVQLVYTYSK